MANLFDAAQSPTTEPTKIVVGDFIQWRRTNLSSDYPNSEYTMSYVGRISADGTSEITIAATNYESDYLFTVSSATSAAYKVGKYRWQLEATQTSSGNRIVIDRGMFEILPDLDVGCDDPRSHAEIMVGKIESLLNGKADADVANYSIAGRSLTKLSFDELLKARDYYKSEYHKEVIADRINKGQETGTTIRVRFT
jgi:hypothetical protein